MSRRRISYIVLSSLISLAFILLGIFVFKDSYLRLIEAFRDLWVSIKYYFVTLFMGETDIVPTVIDYSHIFDKDITDNINPLPPTQDDFVGQSTTYFDLLFSMENFSAWGYSLLDGLLMFSRILTLVLPMIILLKLVIKKIYSTPNNKFNHDTWALSCHKTMDRYLYSPIKDYVLGFVEFVWEYRFIAIIWLTLWALHLNLVTIFIAFIAYYMYFAVSFTFGTIYVQICKLFIDIKIGFRGWLIWLLIPFAILMYNSWRRKIATNRLQHHEAIDCGFINELPIVSMSVGSMGKKKTTLITDMALSQEVMFRQKAFEILQNNDMKFSKFPWISLELEIRHCMEHKVIYNLASIRDWMTKKKSRFYKHWDAHLQLYDYDVDRYGMYYHNGLYVEELFDVLETYAKAYFIYVIESSLLVSNYSIREDNLMVSEGNFPMWNMDFFPKKSREDSRHAHILDFDILRLGKKVIEDNINIGSFEFGIINMTEIGKERGNNLELKELKKGTNDTNQKNDLFNSWLKMCRHSATVDNFPFIKVFTDEQRPESWGADARDLCDIVHIIKTDKNRIAYPLYTIEEMISEWAFSKFIGMYYNFRYLRGDNTLLVHFLKDVVGLVYRRNIRLYNKYGYSILRVEKERGTMDSKPHKQKYYLANRKIYSKRFSTDCFSDYFYDLAKNSVVGLNDYIEYATEKATVDELKLQNSYFINALYKNNTP